jgi:hypothetical protein
MERECTTENVELYAGHQIIDRIKVDGIGGYGESDVLEAKPLEPLHFISTISSHLHNPSMKTKKRRESILLPFFPLPPPHPSLSSSTCQVPLFPPFRLPSCSFFVRLWMSCVVHLE